MLFHQNHCCGPWERLVRQLLKPALLLSISLLIPTPMVMAQGGKFLDDLGLTCAPDDDPYYSKCDSRGGSPDCDPTIFGQVDVLSLRRDIRSNTPLLWNQTNEIAASGDINEKYSVGPRVRVGVRFLPQTTVEATWFDQDAWDGSKSYYDTLGNLYTPFGEANYPVPGVDPTNQARIDSRSYFGNLELNFRRYFVINDNYNIRSSLFAGPRYMKFDDRLGYSFDASPSLLGAETTNDLFGGQLGGSLDFAIGRNCWITFVGSGGIAGNSYHVAQWYDGTWNDRKESQTSYFGDLDVSFLWRFQPWMAITFGYKAIWLENVATAAQNLGTDWDAFQSAMTTINDKTDAVFHGPHAGCEFRF